MFTDVCIPNENEEEFIKIAEALNTKSLLFLYEKKPKDLRVLQTKTKIKLYSGLIAGKNINIEGIVFARAEQQNIENGKFKFLFGFESLEEKDSFHFRRSGANQVLCRIMKEKDKVFVIDMEKIISAGDASTLLGRMLQNLMLIKKYKLNSVICSFATKPENLRAREEYASLIRAAGYQDIAKNATETLSVILEKNKQASKQEQN